MVDVVIIGLGCAGYTAAIYCARYKLLTLIVGDKEGGTGMAAAEVGDWPGTQFITGPELMENLKAHALTFDSVTHKLARVERIAKDIDGFTVHLQGGEAVQGRTVILTTGTKHRLLDVPGEKEFAGKGVTYCATCDAFFFKGKDVAVLGGGDSAVEGAAIAAQVARTVYLIHRRKEFRAEPYWVERVLARDNVKTVLESNVIEILGDTNVTGVRLDKPWKGSDTITLDGVFVEIGADPDSALALDAGCALDERRFVKVNAGMGTSVPGIFAAGDLTNASNYFAQFVTAAGEGGVAANSVFHYLSKQRNF